MRSVRREIRRLMGPRPSILQRDGSRVDLPSPPGTAQAQVYTHLMQCAVADYSREPRPPALKWHHVVASAADHLSAIRLFNTDFEPGRFDHSGGPFCLDCLLTRGELLDVSLAFSDPSIDVRPIPHGETEPIPWADVHAFYSETVVA